MLMRKLFLFAAALVCGLSLSAKTLYLAPGVWNVDGAKFAIYYFNNETDNGWSEFMSAADANTFQADIPDAYGNVIFVRLNGEASAPSWEAKWNQTEDLALSGDNNLYTISDWGGDKSPGTWSVYGQGGGGDNPGGGGSGGGGSQSGEYDYYLKGYRGPNQGDITTPTAEELFEGGILSYTWEGDDNGKGYFFVLVCEVGQVVGKCYMAKDYSEDTHCTLYDQDATGNSQKLGVKAPSATFYLYDNEDGTLELSTQEIPGKKLVGGGGQGIENVVYTLDVTAPMYDLLGRQVNEDYRGIVIQNGHKFVR